MSRSALGIVCCLATLAAAAPAVAEKVLPLRFVTYDGAWDCKDPADARVGALVIADKTYAFINPDGKLGGYGQLSVIDGDYDLPKYYVSSGYLKDQMKVIGLAMRGPKENWEYTDGELFVFAVLGPDDKQGWYCTRRGGRANAAPAVQ
jgi:hypothetical protein